jgi:hypothetical protein
VVEEALIRRRRTEDLSHSVHLTVNVGHVLWRLRRSLADRGTALPLLSASVSGIQFKRCQNTNR